MARPRLGLLVRDRLGPGRFRGLAIRRPLDRRAARLRARGLSRADHLRAVRLPPPRLAREMGRLDPLRLPDPEALRRAGPDHRTGRRVLEVLRGADQPPEGPIWPTTDPEDRPS